VIACLRPDGELEYINCGHIPPLITKEGGGVARLREHNVPGGECGRRPFWRPAPGRVRTGRAGYSCFRPHAPRRAAYARRLHNSRSGLRLQGHACTSILHHDFPVITQRTLSRRECPHKQRTHRGQVISGGLKAEPVPGRITRGLA
jgi:hypothetical protein